MLRDTTPLRDSTQPQTVNFLTPAQLQEELQIGQKLCYRLLREGRIPSTRVGNLIRIYRPHLEQALFENPDLTEDKKKGGCPPKDSRHQMQPPTTMEADPNDTKT